MSHKLVLLWADGFAINGRLRHKHAKDCWELKDAELRCRTPLYEPPGKLIAPNPVSALCCEWIPIEYMLLGIFFIWSNFLERAIYLIPLSPTFLLFLLLFWLPSSFQLFLVQLLLLHLLGFFCLRVLLLQRGMFWLRKKKSNSCWC